MNESALRQGHQEKVGLFALGLAEAVANIREESRRMDGWPSWNISRQRAS
jgi:hypothetical protein